MKPNVRTISAPFLFLLLFELGFFGILMAKGLMPKGHDGFIHLSLQYYFLNHVVQFGDIPLWIPFMTHGSLSAWWYPTQAGFLQSLLLYSGDLLKSLNFLYIYDLGMLVDELVLALGTWLLARRLFKHAWTALFASLSVMGSCIWMSQPWFNFHFYYCLPMILYFGHRFLDTGQWRWALLAANLLIFQLMGNLPYFVTIIALVVFLYFGLYAVCSQRLFAQQLGGVKWIKGWGCLVLIGINLLLAFQVLSIGSNQIVNYNYERFIDSTVPLKTFLHYGYAQNISRWLELVTGISPTEDYTLYIGIPALALALLGLLRLRRRHRHIALLTVLLFLISQGTLIAAAFYYVWPMMKYYRHLSLLSCFIKLFLCFLAAAGFESLLRRHVGKNEKFVLWPLAAGFAVVSAALVYFSGQYEQTVQLLTSIVKFSIPIGRYEAGAILDWAKPEIAAVLKPRAVEIRLLVSALLCLLAAGLLILVSLQSTRHRRILLMLVIAVQAFDVLHYKFAETQVRTTIIGKNTELLSFQPLRYFQRRSSFFDLKDNRVKLLWDTVPFPGILHWTLNAFLSFDQIDHPYRTDYWLKPLDKLVRGLNGQNIDDLSAPPKGLTPYMKWEFPEKPPAAWKITGVNEDKVQFFSRAFATDDVWTAGRLADDNYQGNQLYISTSEPAAQSPPEVTEDWRLRPYYYILRFTSDELQIKVEALKDKEVWLYYSDVWHPFWKAMVNDHPAEVVKANLAYKAVRLDEGSNIVKLYFKRPWQSFLYNIFAINALLLLTVFIWLMRRVLTCKNI